MGCTLHFQLDETAIFNGMQLLAAMSWNFHLCVMQQLFWMSYNCITIQWSPTTIFKGMQLFSVNGMLSNLQMQLWNFCLYNSFKRISDFQSVFLTSDSQLFIFMLFQFCSSVNLVNSVLFGKLLSRTNTPDSRKHCKFYIASTHIVPWGNICLIPELDSLLPNITSKHAM